MTVYLYDKDGYYLGTQEAQPNPKKKGAYLMPYNGTAVAPPDVPVGKRARWVASEWVAWDDATVPKPLTVQQKTHRIREKADLEIRSAMGRYFPDDPVSLVPFLLIGAVMNLHQFVDDSADSHRASKIIAHAGLLYKEIDQIRAIRDRQLLELELFTDQSSL